jgi:hypothetical protein
MLSGKLPYGAKLAQARTKSQQRKLRYRSVLDDFSEIPAWIDRVLARAVHPDPSARYDELSEFLYDLRHPNPRYLNAPLEWRAENIDRKSIEAHAVGGDHVFSLMVSKELQQWMKENNFGNTIDDYQRKKAEYGSEPAVP